MAGAGIEPDIENVVLFREFRRSALRADGSRRHQFGGGLLEPDIGGMLCEQIHHAVQNLPIGQRIPARRAIEHDDRHAPDALARNAPVGPARDHVGDAFFAPLRHPLHGFDRIERLLPKAVVVHPDEPLFGGAEDGGVVAAPAMRIRVLDVLDREQRAVLFQDIDDERIAFPDGLAEELERGSAPRSAFGVEEAPGGIHRAIDRQPVLHADDVIFLAVAGRRMNRAGALFQRHVIAEDPERIAVDEGMPEGGAFKLVAVEPGDDLGFGPAAFLRGRFEQIRRNDVNVVADFHRHVFEFRMKRDREVGRQRPRRGGPDQAVDVLPGQCGIDRRRIGRQRKANPDRRALMVFILDFGFGERRAVMDAPVDRLQPFIDVALVEKVDESAAR